MSDFDKPVTKAQTDTEILDALHGVKMVQRDLRAGLGGGLSLAFFKAYYDKLPEEIARRLTEIDAEAVARITQATGFGLSGEIFKRFAGKLAGDAAFAQVIRAANRYREKLGFGPLGPDGEPGREEGAE